MKQNQLLLIAALVAAAYYWFKIRPQQQFIAQPLANTQPLLTSAQPTGMIAGYR